jgi:hypothetical protein
MTAMTTLTADVLILGNGPGAARLIDNLDNAGYSLIVAIGDGSREQPSSHASLTTLPQSQIVRVNGAAGYFNVDITAAGQPVTAAVKQIAVTEDSERTPLFTPYGVAPGDGVCALSDLTDARASAVSGPVVFLVGLATESNPVVTRQAMTQAIALRAQHGQRSFFLTGNLKVGDNGMEALYREAKAAGVAVFKFSRTRPSLEQDPGGGTIIRFEDETSREAFQLTAELVVVDEIVHPTPVLADHAAALALHTDAAGFDESVKSVKRTASENVRDQGLRILRNEAYLQYAAMTKDDA